MTRHFSIRFTAVFGIIGQQAVHIRRMVVTVIPEVSFFGDEDDFI